MNKRYFLILQIFILATLSGFARCGNYGLTAFPISDNISTNSIFIVQGYGSSRGIIDSLNIKYPVYLVSGDQRINLIVIEVNQGMYKLNQAILKPENSLDPKSTYELRIDNLPEFRQNSLQKWDPIEKKSKTAKWTVNESVDTQAPTFVKPPKFKENTYKARGSGPEMFSVFKFKTSDKEATLVKTELRGIIRRDTTTHTYYLQQVANNDLKVGRRMCSGEFTFEKRHQYQIRFKLLDYSGNTDGQWTDWMELEYPGKK